MLSIEQVNTKTSKTTIFGWLAGLAFYSWFASDGPSLPVWMHAVLIFGGMFAASIIIGGGTAMIAAAITKAVTGNSQSNSDFYAWATFIAPVLAFFAAKYVLAAVA